MKKQTISAVVEKADASAVRWPCLGHLPDADALTFSDLALDEFARAMTLHPVSLAGWMTSAAIRPLLRIAGGLTAPTNARRPSNRNH